MIVVENLTKRYGEQTAVADVSFRCEPGTVTGFLGPNGAGKSTTMRMMTGLTPPSSGRSTINGATYRELGNPGRHVGVLLDASATHKGRTGRESLTLSAMTMGVPRSKVAEMLKLVGLAGPPEKKRLGNYSLGMRQRFGLANALLGDPAVLILDEPANGLDPEGIHWMRGLLRGFADRGGTVLLSSHLLYEVEAVADQLVIIGGGKIVAAGGKRELLAAADTSSGTTVAGPDLAGLERCLTEAGLRVVRGTDDLHVEAEPLVVSQAAAAGQQVVTELRVAQTGGLEKLFFELTSAPVVGQHPAGPADPSAPTEEAPR